MKKIITMAAMFTSFAVINKTEAQIGYDAGSQGAAADANYNNSGNYNNNNNPGNYNNTNNYNNGSYSNGNYNTDDYYYLPDIDAYYNIPLQQYVYLDGGRWLTSAYLPAMYRGFDLYAANKFRVHEARPYLRADFYRNRYASYRNNYRAAPVVVNRGGGYAYNNGGYGRDYGHVAYNNVYRDNRQGGFRNDRHFDNGGGARGGNYGGRGGHEEHGGGRGGRR